MSVDTEEYAKLVVMRESDRDIRMRDLVLYIDGAKSANIQFGERFEAELEPGKHVVKVSNRLYSKSVEFFAAAGQSVIFEAGNVADGVFMMFMVVTGMGPYHVFLERVAAERSEVPAGVALAV
jgi:hypothetical protein